MKAQDQQLLLNESLQVITTTQSLPYIESTHNNMTRVLSIAILANVALGDGWGRGYETKAFYDMTVISAGTYVICM